MREEGSGKGIGEQGKEGGRNEGRLERGRNEGGGRMEEVSGCRAACVARVAAFFRGGSTEVGLYPIAYFNLFILCYHKRVH